MARTNILPSLVVLVVLAGRVVGEQAGPPSPSRTGEGGVVWSQSYEVGERVAKMQDCPRMLLFTASWCQWCRKLEQEVLAQPQVASALRRFACVKIDVEKRRDIALAYGVASMPRVIVVNTQNEIIGDWLGYRDAEEFLRLLADIQPYLNTAAGVRKAPEIAAGGAGSQGGGGQPQAAPSDPAVLIDLLGSKQTEIRRNVMDVLVKGGAGVLPVLTDALGHDYLGVRITAWKVIRLLSGAELEFDPWASRAERAEAVKGLQEKLNVVPPAREPNTP